MKKKNRETKRRGVIAQPWWPRAVKNQGVETPTLGETARTWSRVPVGKTLTEKELFAIAAKNKKETT